MATNLDRRGLRTWAVSTPHAAASRAAVRTFERGGNAVDAALAAAAMLTVVYPNQCSLGGDLIALVGDAEGHVTTINASGRAPRALDAEAFARSHRTMPIYGADPVTVPGVVSGWHALCDHWGTRPFGEMLEDATAAAAEGVPVSPGLARALRQEEARVRRDPGLAEVFTDGGRIIGPGEPLRQPRLAASLGLLAERGPSAMYRGSIGANLVATLHAAGSALTLDDFARHTVDVGAPATTMFHGTEYVTSGGNSQGVYFLAGLHALDQLWRDGVEMDPLGAPAGRIGTVLARAAHRRDASLGDVAARDDAAVIDDLVCDLLEPTLRGAAPAAAPVAHGDTAAVTTVDGDGLWVSLLQSVFHTFGSGILDPATGIVLQNRGASFALREGAPGQFLPGRRPPHTLMPVMTRHGGTIDSCVAAMGGRAQPLIQTHVAMALASGTSLMTAVARPRWVLGALDADAPDDVEQRAQVEEDVPAEAVRSLATAGFRIVPMGRLADDAGHVAAVRQLDGALGSHIGADGRIFEAAADPRADGAAFVGPDEVVAEW